MNDSIPLSKLTQLDDGSYIEEHGLSYKDFKVGLKIKHRPGRTITDTDNTWMSLICHNNHPLHIDHEYGKKTEFGKVLVSSLVTFSIVSGLSLQGTSINAIANLGWKEVKLEHPVFIGDTLYAETQILEKRVSKSRPNQGIVTVRTSGYNQDGKRCLTSIRSFLMPIEESVRQ